MPRPPLPPLTLGTATPKVRLAEDVWNGHDPARVALAHSPDSHWRNRSTFLQGRAEIEAFLTQEWERALEYRLVKELLAFRKDRIAARFAHEWHEAGGQWFRSYGSENCAFDGEGLMHARIASINDLAIEESERLRRWPAGRQTDDHAGLTELRL